MMRLRAAGFVLFAGIALLVAAAVIRLILSETTALPVGAAVLGAGLAGLGAWRLRGRIVAAFSGARRETASFTLAVLCTLVALGYLSVTYPLRLDVTPDGIYSLSSETRKALTRLGAPVHITFFHDPMLRASVELYQLFADESDMVILELHDPNLNPAAARMQGVRFAGTAVLESEGRRQLVHGSSEIDIINGILRISLGVVQRICFLDGHVEADPFSTEDHDHQEGMADHEHGLGVQYVLHERHGIAKARHALETINFTVETVTLAGGGSGLSDCSLLVVAGPKTALLVDEVDRIHDWLDAGNNAFFLLEPFVTTGLEPLLGDYGIVLDDVIVIDEARYFWADVSAPAVTSYNHHRVTRELALTFFPGVRSLSPTSEPVSGTSVIPLVNTSTSSYGETDPARAAFDEGQDLAGPRTLMAIGVRRFQEAGGAADPKRSRIAVVGDADFATNSFFHLLGNGNLFLNTINYLVAEENLIGIEPRSHDLPEVNMTNRQLKAMFFLSIVLLPGLIAFVGVAMWWRRR